MDKEKKKVMEKETFYSLSYELCELQSKRYALHQFMDNADTSGWDNLTEVDRVMLIKQREAMTVYATILSRRINLQLGDGV